MTDKQYVYVPDQVSVPGDTLKELLDERGITHDDLAARTGLSLMTIRDIVSGRAQITSATATQLERALGLSASFWNAREAHYRGNDRKQQSD